MRVAYFSECIPPLTDGVSRTIDQLVSSLDQAGVDFRFYSGMDPGPELPWREHVRKLPSLPFLPYRDYHFALPLLCGLGQDLDRFRPDLIHALNPTLLGVYAQRYAARRGIPVVSSYHTRFVSYFPYYGLGRFEPLGWGLLRRFYTRCARTYAPSDSAAAELRARGVKRIELWSRGVDTARFNPLYRSSGLAREISGEREPVLLFVGRLVREKDLADLARAAELLRERGARFKMVFVGDGPMRGELESRLPYAHFTGHLSGEALSRWYASADLFVFPSTTETFGNVILEAFASALPVVGVAAGGSGDLISPGVNGLLAQPHDAGDLSRKIESLLQDREQRTGMGEAALRTSRRYEWSGVNRDLLASYERVVVREPGVSDVEVSQLVTS